ncbi:MAG: FIST N-terminal domain-containing protein [Candidatus Omnitrophica bacterium]|nr:FIST N-terminal domain-containing protein [Candidatus Omnitrophota bacterium]
MEIGVGISTEKNQQLAIREAIQTAKASITANTVDFALVFGTAEFSYAGVLKTIAGLLPGTSIIGSSSPAIICNKGVFDHGLAVMLIKYSEEIQYHTGYAVDIRRKDSVKAGEEFGEKICTGFQQIPRSAGLIFYNSSMAEGGNFSSGLQEKIGRSFPLIGAFVSNGIHALHTQLYFNQEVFNDSCVGVLWGGKLTYSLGVRHGWKPLGKPHTITSSVGNIVAKIDDEPAAMLYSNYLGFDLSRLRKELKHISVFYPLGLSLQGEKEYLLRNILSIEDDGSLICQGNVPEQSTVRVMIGTPETCLDAAEQATEDALQNFTLPPLGAKKGKIKRCAIVLSSYSRYVFLKRQITREAERIKKKLGNEIPMIGIYTSGELAPLRASSYRGQLYFHNQTITVLLIGG